MCSKSPKSSFCHPSAPIATISAPESITHNLQKEGKIDQKIAALCKKKSTVPNVSCYKIVLIHPSYQHFFQNSQKSEKCKMRYFQNFV